MKRQDSHFGKMSSSSPFPKLPTGTTSGHKVTRNSFRGQGLYFGGLYFVDRGKMLPFSDATAKYCDVKQGKQLLDLLYGQIHLPLNGRSIH